MLLLLLRIVYVEVCCLFGIISDVMLVLLRGKLLDPPRLDSAVYGVNTSCSWEQKEQLLTERLGVLGGVRCPSEMFRRPGSLKLKYGGIESCFDRRLA